MRPGAIDPRKVYAVCLLCMGAESHLTLVEATAATIVHTHEGPEVFVITGPELEARADVGRLVAKRLARRREVLL